MNIKKENLKIEVLNPVFEGVESYYRKAYTVKDNNSIILLSYGVPVAIVHADGNGNAYGWAYNGIKTDLTATTLRHIKEFLKQHNYFNITKKDIVNGVSMNLKAYEGIIL